MKVPIIGPGHVYTWVFVVVVIAAALALLYTGP